MYNYNIKFTIYVYKRTPLTILYTFWIYTFVVLLMYTSVPQRRSNLFD